MCSVVCFGVNRLIHSFIPYFSCSLAGSLPLRTECSSNHTGVPSSPSDNEHAASDPLAGKGARLRATLCSFFLVRVCLCVSVCVCSTGPVLWKAYSTELEARSKWQMLTESFRRFPGRIIFLFKWLIRREAMEGFSSPCK